MIKYLSVEEIFALHEIGISEFGGSKGLRDMALLESAVAQPQQGFGGNDLYVDLWGKTAALGFSISENQPFIDGNKRTATLSMMVFLELNDYELHVEKNKVYEMIMDLANKRLSREGLAKWLKKNSKPLKRQ